MISSFLARFRPRVTAVHSESPFYPFDRSTTYPTVGYMRRNSPASVATIVAVCCLLQILALPAANLVRNGSFEVNHFAHWGTSGGLDVRINTFSPDGTNHVVVLGSLFQDQPTTSNETYYIRFLSGQAPPGASFAGQSLTLTSNRVGVWYSHEGYAMAPGASSRLTFGNPGGTVDGVQVISTLEPPQVVLPPESRSVLQGGSATFLVKADGGRPLSYQWHFNDALVAGETNALLQLTNLQSEAAGLYTVTVSNTNGTTNVTAELTVERPSKAPTIIAQPSGATLNVGYGYNLSVVVIGEAPLFYQWFWNESPLPGATNYSLSFPSIQLSNAGVYSIRAENSHGSVLSLPATITLTNFAGGGGLLRSFNTSPARYIFDVDGITKLSGGEFLVQLYAGPSPAALRPVGPVRPFLTGLGSGRFVQAEIPVPDMAPNQMVYVQTRVWQTNLGNFYEDVRIRGGKYNVSELYSVLMPSGGPFVASDVPINSFSLRAGAPYLSTGNITVNSRPHGQPIEWKLTGAAGFTYVIEKRTPPQDWAPLLILTNMTGTVLFTDTNAGTSSANFYRSRMID